MSITLTWLLHPRRIAGIVCILGVIGLWVGVAELRQFILDTNSFPRPMFLTFFGSCLQSALLVQFLSNPVWQARLQESCKRLQAIDLPKVVKSASDQALPHEVFQLALYCGITSLFADYTRNLSICFSCGTGTTVASNTVLMSTMSFWALLMGVTLGDERPTMLKFGAMLLSICGAVLVTRVFSQDTDPTSSTLVGDLLSVVSAILFALFTVQIKRFVPHTGTVDVTMLIGFVGVVRAVIAFPLLLLLHFTGIEPHHPVPARILVCLTSSGLLGTVICNVLLTKAVSLTSPLLTNLGTALQIPLSFFADQINPLSRNPVFTWDYVLGTVAILGAFVVVAAEGDDERDEREDADAEESRTQ